MTWHLIELSPTGRKLYAMWRCRACKRRGCTRADPDGDHPKPSRCVCQGSAR